jgi:hypothetical protein
MALATPIKATIHQNPGFCQPFLRSDTATQIAHRTVDATKAFSREEK